VKTLHSVINFCTTTPFQKAVAKAFVAADQCNYFEWLPKLLKEKRDRLCTALDFVGMDYILPQGGYFVVVNVKKFYGMAGIDENSFESLTADTPLNDRPDVRFSKWLISEIGIGPIPMSPFYIPEQRHLANNYIRLAYCKDDATLDLAIERLKNKLKT
jgi:kynurenine aminotransferase